MQTRPETLDFLDRAPFVVHVQRALPHAPAPVFDVLADTPSWTRWWPRMEVAEWTSTQQGGVGAQRRVRVRGLEVHEQFIAWEPGASWGFTYLRTNAPLGRAGVELVELSPTDGGTAIRYTIALEPHRGMRAISRALAGRFRAGLDEGLTGLERYLGGR